MSQSDSFIEEVTEEVRRDRLFAAMKRYGWIAVLLVLLLVGGAAWREYSKVQQRQSAEALGDALIGALEINDVPARIEALSTIAEQDAPEASIAGFLIAAEEVRAGDNAAAVARLEALAASNEPSMIYRQIAAFKALTFQGQTSDAATRRAGFEALSGPGAPLRLLAEEQLALIDIETDQTEAALERLQLILKDANVTAGLRRRATQLIVALGGEPSAPENGLAVQNSGIASDG